MTTAVVVGGASGIGAAVVEHQRAMGIDVVVWDLAESADVRCDLRDPDQVDDATSATLDRIGPPDLVTVTAGIGHGAMLLDVDADEWDRVVGTNAKGVWLAMRALARPMLDAGGGSIVATSSVSARLADATMGLYCASKAALDMVIKVAAIEWAPTLRVNGVAPGVTDTPMLGRAPRDKGWLQRRRRPHRARPVGHRRRRGRGHRRTRTRCAGSPARSSPATAASPSRAPSTPSARRSPTAPHPAPPNPNFVFSLTSNRPRPTDKVRGLVGSHRRRAARRPHPNFVSHLQPAAAHRQSSRRVRRVSSRGRGR